MRRCDQFGTLRIRREHIKTLWSLQIRFISKNQQTFFSLFKR